MGDATPQQATEIRAQLSLHLMSISVLYWDYLITLDSEMNLMWRRAGSSTLLFLAVRYLGLGGLSLTVFTFFFIPEKVCYAFHVVHQIILIGTQLLVSVVMLVRVYALYGRSYRILAVLILISLGLLSALLWSIQAEFSQHTEPITGYPGCATILTRLSQYHLAFAWESLFVFDSLMFGFTVYKTYSECGSWRGRGIEMRMGWLPIHTLMLRDGAMYFGAMALANLCNIVTFYLGGPVLSGSLSTFASSMSVTMMCRLMLNLHETARQGHGQLDDDEVEAGLHSLAVFRVIGSVDNTAGEREGERGREGADADTRRTGAEEVEPPL
ncbi:hypothetical protein FB45DRAFT_1005639 [Roridomyces roridus]|uniref:DUF6533 domain-containing protein n=1 Tax=Roridomyces roridus TaxID=1738132 RepID=A0AAD7BLX5_9AGAR|nr:hypothetical protein FB45DRAFT_1005639 [Roridomyces roridus]